MAMHGKVRRVLGEFKRGTLKSGSGAKVTSRRQAVAIALSEARKAGENIPPNPEESNLTRMPPRKKKKRKRSNLKF